MVSGSVQLSSRESPILFRTFSTHKATRLKESRNSSQNTLNLKIYMTQMKKDLIDFEEEKGKLLKHIQKMKPNKAKEIKNN
jgi:hypothetical protein